MSERSKRIISGLVPQCVISVAAADRRELAA